MTVWYLYMYVLDNIAYYVFTSWFVNCNSMYMNWTYENCIVYINQITVNNDETCMIL